MSLVKLDKDGRIKESCAEKKTTKRLKIILKKVSSNKSKLFDMWWDLKYYNLDVTEVKRMWEKFLLLESMLNKVINKRLQNGNQTNNKI
jgi:hypothetical protein